METIPAIVKDIEMNDAIVMMVDSNFQRQSLLPSEKARAYKMKLDAVKRQGARRDLSSDHDEQKLRGKTSRDLIAENSPDSSTQIQRFILRGVLGVEYDGYLNCEDVLSVADPKKSVDEIRKEVLQLRRDPETGERAKKPEIKEKTEETASKQSGKKKSLLADLHEKQAKV